MFNHAAKTLDFILALLGAFFCATTQQVHQIDTSARALVQGIQSPFFNVTFEFAKIVLAAFLPVIAKDVVLWIREKRKNHAGK